MNLLLINVLLKSVPVLSIKLQNTIKGLYNTASTITFIKKALFVNFISVFAKVKGKFSNEKNHAKLL